jgi:hypothetical protein
MMPGWNCAKNVLKSENSANWLMKLETARLSEAWVAGVAGFHRMLVGKRD